LIRAKSLQGTGLSPEGGPDYAALNTLKYLVYLFTGILEVHERMIF
jgi:hypothetical protein